MITTIFSDIFDSVGYLFGSGSPVILVLMVCISIFAGLRMSNANAIFGWVFESTLILAVFMYFWNWLASDGRFSFSVWERETVDSWRSLMALSLQELIGYFALFFLLILAVHIVKRFAKG